MSLLDDSSQLWRPSEMTAQGDVRPNQRKRVVLALTPLTIVLVVLIMGDGDKTGPYRGNVRSALVAAASLGIAVIWISMLWATKARSKG
jgi:hypothetical protein